jgi:hypothetical protein
VHEFVETADSGKKSWKLMLGDELGGKYLLAIDKGYLMGYKFKKTSIFPGVKGVLTQVIENGHLLILVTLDDVKIFSSNLNLVNTEAGPNNLHYSLIDYERNTDKVLRNIVPCVEILTDTDSSGQVPSRGPQNVCWKYKIVVSWGDFLDFLLIKKTKTTTPDDPPDFELPTSYSVEGLYRIALDHRIILLYEMCADYLLLIDEEMGATPLYINTKLFHVHLFQRRLMNQEIAFRSNLRSLLDNKHRKHYSNTALHLKTSGRVYLLTKRVIFVKLLDWKGYMDRLITEDNWIRAFNFYETIYNHRMRYFVGVCADKWEQNKLMEGLMDLMVKKYIKANLEVELEKFKDEEFEREGLDLEGVKNELEEEIIDWNQIYSILIEFLIKCGKGKEVLNWLKTLSEESGHLDQYYKAIKPYLLKN